MPTFPLRLLLSTALSGLALYLAHTCRREKSQWVLRSPYGPPAAPPECITSEVLRCTCMCSHEVWKLPCRCPGQQIRSLRTFVPDLPKQPAQ